ncbi:hypothetical protein FB479_101749 [Brevibacillus sp. AG162]|nr:hypothetical protein FB479_101749 [Brevibacillus sp. AG162]
MLEVLAPEEYIEWKRSEPDNMTVLEAWERKELHNRTRPKK